MSKRSPFGDTPPIGQWLFGIGSLLLFVPSALNGGAMILHRPIPFAFWQIHVAQVVFFLLWGTALLLTALVQHRRHPLPALFQVPQLWFGLLFFGFLPTSVVIALEDYYTLPEGPVLWAILLLSIMATLFCAVLGVFFWWRKRRVVARSDPRSL